MEKCVHLDHIALGVCYYPEQWPRTMWQSDLRRMKAHGIETVRVFEFAWSVIEPKDDTWDFSLFDEFLSLAAEEKMQVIMGTPSATPHATLVRLAICIGYPTHTGISPAPFHSYIAVIPNTYAFSSA